MHSFKLDTTIYLRMHRVWLQTLTCTHLPPDPAAVVFGLAAAAPPAPAAANSAAGAGAGGGCSGGGSLPRGLRSLFPLLPRQLILG